MESFTLFSSDASCSPLQLTFAPKQSVAQAIFLSGLIRPPALCSGIGTCGLCRVQFLSTAPAPLQKECSFFSTSDLESGWRLGCQHKIQKHIKLRLPHFISLYSQDKKITEIAANKNGSGCLMAIDLGTTSLHWSFSIPKSSTDYNPLERKKWERKSEINPQMGAGSDLISRLSYALQDKGELRLQKLVTTRLRSIIKESTLPVTAACLAANPGMTLLALGKDIQSIATAPYSLGYKGGVWETIVDIPCPVWIPPQLSPFVGGDVSAGFASIVCTEPDLEYPFLLVDMGTNGEFLLALGPDDAIVTSVALGPALEGINLRFGTAAAPGATTAYSLSPQAILAKKEPPSLRDSLLGITGTGYLSLLALLIKTHALNESGQFTLTKSALFSHIYNKQFGVNASAEVTNFSNKKTPLLRLPENLYLTTADIEEILKVKAAFSLGLALLLKHAKIQSQALKRIYLAGALGTHVSVSDLETLGFFPKGAGLRLHAIGNASLAGAELLAQNKRARKKLVTWAKHVRHYDLSGDQEFLDRYPEAMRFLWKSY